MPGIPVRIKAGSLPDFGHPHPPDPGKTVLQLAAFAPIRFGDVTALLEIAPEEAQRLLDAMLQAGALEEKEGWYQIAK